jgi:Arc/MetJ family transcription regulator
MGSCPGGARAKSWRLSAEPDKGCDGLLDSISHTGASFTPPLRTKPGTSGISTIAFARYTELMSKHLVDIDNDLLEEATSILGASTMKEAVNRSLESVVLAARRRSHADRLGAMAGLDLDDASVMSGAWR